MSELRYRAVELVTAPEGRARGYITTFNDPYEYAPRVRETITPTTFDLQRSATIPVMYQHNHDEPPVGTAQLSTDGKGIVADVQFFMDTERGRAAFHAYHSGAMREWSVGFTAKPDGITTTRADGYVDERIDKGDLMEVSTVLRGANKNTSTLSTRAAGDGTGLTEPNANLPREGSTVPVPDEGAAAGPMGDSDTHRVSAAVPPSMIDAMAAMAGAMKQMNSAHALLEQAHAGQGALLAPSTDDAEDDYDTSGPTPVDPADAPGAALRAEYEAALLARATAPWARALLRHDYSADQRKEMAKSGEAMPDGSYPIANATDLENAIHAIGRGSDPHSAIRAHIIARAKALGLEKMLPADWTS